MYVLYYFNLLDTRHQCLHEENVFWILAVRLDMGGFGGVSCIWLLFLIKCKEEADGRKRLKRREMA